MLTVLVASCGGGGGTDGDDGFEVVKFEPAPVTKSNSTGLYVHYMPWFETKETNGGKWGQHWTMANRNPDNVAPDGTREIAAHYYPLIGPYASSDAEVIDYHLLLMKYSGIDVVLIDWYGTRDLYDYPANRRNTEALVKGLERVGLEFAIVYEDQTLGAGGGSDQLDASAQIDQAQRDMQYLETNFFGKSNYVRIDGKPLLMTFGPQQLNTAAEWTSVFAVLRTKPAFVALYGHARLANSETVKNATGEYIWVDAIPIETKYAEKENFDIFWGGAWPGFDDFYVEGGGGTSPLADIDHENGALLTRLLDMAKTQGVERLQLITWNDFGEGTMLEPTREFGFNFLGRVQSFAGVSYSTSTLEGILDYYNLKKELKGDKEAEKRLQQAFYYYISAQESEAAQLMNELKN
jgi:hypothetical protein